MSDSGSVRKARAFNLFLFFLIAVMIAVLVGIVSIMVYFALAGNLSLYDVVVCLILFCIAIPLTILQYYYQKDPLVKKVLWGIMITLWVWTIAMIMTVILEIAGMKGLSIVSSNLINFAYIPLLAMMISVMKLPGSRKYDPAIGRFVVFFAAVIIMIICVASGYLAVERGTLSASALIGTIVTGVDVLTVAIAALLILSYMPTGYRYVFAVLILVGILCFTADSLMLITTLGLADFSQIYMLCYGALIITGTIAMIGLSLVNISPTTVEEVDKKLSDTRMQMEDIVMQSPDAMCIFDESGQVIMANSPLYRILQAGGMEKLDINLFSHIGHARPDMAEQFSKIRQGHIFTMDDVPVYLNSRKNDPIYISVKVFPTFAADGKISGYVAIMQDTTNRKQAAEAMKKLNEELEQRVKERTFMLESANDALQREIEARKADEKQIKESLREKEVLLKEIHHRVKNNLQIVSSMLSLQSSSIKDPAIVAMNTDSQNRIRSMALIHEKLYQTKNLSRVDFGEYARSLVNFIQGSYNARNVAVTIDIADVWLDIDIAIPCGLIINELFSNCIKHAFGDRDAGEVYITMRADGNRYLLTVKDNGMGMDPGIDISTSPTLGLSLVSALVSQLEGEVQIASEGGTKFSIWFPIETPKKNSAAPEA